MLRKGSNLYNFPVLSLHLGGQLGRIEKEIIDPNNLKIIGFILSGNQMNNGKYGDILDV